MRRRGSIGERQAAAGDAPIAVDGQPPVPDGTPVSAAAVPVASPTRPFLSLKDTPAGLAPLLLLFGLNLVDEFDRVAFAALTPEIRDAFGMSDSGIVAIGAVAAVFTLLSSLPLGYVADRYPRVRLAALAAVVWGSMAVLTGLAPVVVVLFIARLFSGIARTSNEVVHPSLLADYYSPRFHPQVFRVHRLASPLGGASAIIAGVIGATLGWRWAFVLLAIPTVAMLAGFVRLREPRPGESLDVAPPAVAQQAHIPFRVARRQLLAVGTLKRMWLAAFLVGAAMIAFSQLVSLFFEEVYGYGPFGRGIVTFVYQAGALAGIFFGGQLPARAAARDDYARLAVFAGAPWLVFGGGLVLLAVLPWSVPAVTVVALLGVCLGFNQPAYYPLIARVAPPRIRSQAYAWALLFAGLGGIISVPLAEFGERSTYRGAFAVLAAIVAAGGIVQASARRFVPADMAAADASLLRADGAVAAAPPSASHGGVAARPDDRIGQEAADEPVEVPVIETRALCVAYGHLPVIFDVDLTVRRGTVLALLGANGAGKTTLLSAIAGLMPAESGTVRFQGHEVTDEPAEKRIRRGIALVQGGAAIFPGLTVAENLRAGCFALGADQREVARRRDEVLELFPVLRDRMDQRAGTLSGGERQMLSLSKGLLLDAELLCIDELSLGLAPVVVEELIGAVEKLRDEGRTMIIVEQSVSLALRVADEVAVLERGRVVLQGSAERLSAELAGLEAALLGKAP